MRALRELAFGLAVALAALGGERVAAACNGIGPNCSGTTPACELLGGDCVSCTQGILLGLFGCPAGSTCDSDTASANYGACVLGCSTNYDAGSGTSCSADVPECVHGSCMQCSPGMGNEPFCPKNAPDCNGQGFCGCMTSADCPTGTHCDPGGGSLGFGICSSTCNTKQMCNNGQVCVFDGGIDENGPDGGSCVECFGASGCTAPQVCDSTTFICVDQLDAGPLDSGAFDAGDAGDAGRTTTLDAGISDAGGTSTRDATVSDSGEGETDTFPPGKVEGGGCSVLALGAGGSDSPVPPALLGFAGLAGLFFLRRSQRRSSPGRTERR
jgi:MYXO-CTERM domain-containing protein